MNLLESMMTPCRMMDRITTDDPYGGTISRWVPGASLQALIRKDSSSEVLIAEKNGMTELYTVVIHKPLRLRQNDVIMRVSDNETFRITSDSLDWDAPEAATVKIAKATAERWVPTS